MISAEFLVYGHSVDEIENAAKMIARRFFGGRETKLSYSIEQMTSPVDLWEATVTAWSDPDE